MPPGGEETAKRGRTITTMGQLFGSIGPTGGSKPPAGAGAKRDRTLSTFGQLFQSVGVDAGKQYVAPPVEPIGAGRRRRRRREKLPEWFISRRREAESDIARQVRLAIERQQQLEARAILAEEQAGEMLRMETAKREIEARIEDEIEQKESETEKRRKQLASVRYMQYIKTGHDTVFPKGKIREMAEEDAERKIKEEYVEMKRSAEIKKQRLLNLEKAKIAKEKKKKRADEIRAKRLESLAKARKAKKRKRKKKKK